METQILQNTFETAYKEYKEYNTYLDTIQEDVETKRKDFREKVVNTKDSDEMLADELFNLSLRPMQSQEDLRILRNRLINVYDAFKILIDFPTEIIEEIKALKRPLQTYRVSNGKQEIIDKAKYEKQKEVIKAAHLEIISSLKST